MGRSPGADRPVPRHPEQRHRRVRAARRESGGLSGQLRQRQPDLPLPKRDQHEPVMSVSAVSVVVRTTDHDAAIQRYKRLLGPPVPRIAGDVTAGPALVSCVLVSCAPCVERCRFLICSGAASASRRDCLMGVQLGFTGVPLGGEVIGPVYGAAAAARGLASSSGRLSLCFPDDEAPCCGLPRSGPACGPVPAHRPRCFRRSHAWTGRAGRCCRRVSPAECGPAGPCRVSLEW